MDKKWWYALYLQRVLNVLTEDVSYDVLELADNLLQLIHNDIKGITPVRENPARSELMRISSDISTAISNLSVATDPAKKNILAKPSQHEIDTMLALKPDRLAKARNSITSNTEALRQAIKDIG